MAYPAKTQRNKEIVKKRQKGWSFRQIAKYYNIKHSWVHAIYNREVVRVVDNKA